MVRAPGALTRRVSSILCGQFQISEDREAPLLEHRLEWSEAAVDEYVAANRHFCVDTDPHGARVSARLIEAGLIAPELRWLIAGELERRQAVAVPAWVLGGGDGSAPMIGGLVARSGGGAAPRRRVPPACRMAGRFQSGDSDGDSSRSGFDAHKAAVREAQRLVNSGGVAADGAAPVRDPSGLLDGGGGFSGGTWADPSSLG